MVNGTLFTTEVLSTQQPTLKALEINTVAELFGGLGALLLLYTADDKSPDKI